MSHDPAKQLIGLTQQIQTLRVSSGSAAVINTCEENADDCCEPATLGSGQRIIGYRVEVSRVRVPRSFTLGAKSCTDNATGCCDAAPTTQPVIKIERTKYRLPSVCSVVSTYCVDIMRGCCCTLCDGAELPDTLYVRFADTKQTSGSGVFHLFGYGGGGIWGTICGAPLRRQNRQWIFPTTIFGFGTLDIVFECVGGVFVLTIKIVKDSATYIWTAGATYVDCGNIVRGAQSIDDEYPRPCFIFDPIFTSNPPDNVATSYRAVVCVPSLRDPCPCMTEPDSYILSFQHTSMPLAYTITATVLCDTWWYSDIPGFTSSEAQAVANDILPAGDPARALKVVVALYFGGGAWRFRFLKYDQVGNPGLHRFADIDNDSFSRTGSNTFSNGASTATVQANGGLVSFLPACPAGMAPTAWTVSISLANRDPITLTGSCSSFTHFPANHTLASTDGITWTLTTLGDTAIFTGDAVASNCVDTKSFTGIWGGFPAILTATPTGGLVTYSQVCADDCACDQQDESPWAAECASCEVYPTHWSLAISSDFAATCGDALRLIFSPSAPAVFLMGIQAFLSCTWTTITRTGDSAAAQLTTGNGVYFVLFFSNGQWQLELRIYHPLFGNFAVQGSDEVICTFEPIAEDDFDCLGDNEFTAPVWTPMAMSDLGAGTVSHTAGSTTITGTGTAFLTDFGTNQYIVSYGHELTERRKITAIASNTSMTVESAWTQSATNVSYRKAAWTTPANLTGTITVKEGSATVTGSGTLFLTNQDGDPGTGELTTGSLIRTNGGQVRTVASIASNTELTVTEEFDDSEKAVAYKTGFCHSTGSVTITPV